MQRRVWTAGDWDGGHLDKTDRKAPLRPSDTFAYRNQVRDFRGADYDLRKARRPAAA